MELVPKEEPKESEESENDDPDDSETELGKPWPLNNRWVSTADILTERLKNEWNAPVCAFFSSTPTTEYVDGC